MNSHRERLVACFAAVFPGLPADALPSANIDNVLDWDSSHHYMLMQVVEEEFRIKIPEDQLGMMDSFAGFEEYVGQESKTA
jgi:acyl carrier protein